MNRDLDVETLIAWNAARESVFLRERERALADYHRETAAALRAQQERIDALEAALKTIADAPAWGAPDRWDVTPAEVRILARATLTGETHD